MLSLVCVPLGVARWHQHINFCKAPAGRQTAYFGPAAEFGLRGSIATKEACEAAGGTFYDYTGVVAVLVELR